MKMESRIVCFTIIFAVSIGLTGCEWFNLLPRSKISRTDVASSHKGGPSAEISISFFSEILKDEAKGKPCPSAWGTYEQYWKSRMDYIAKNQSKEYYERVFRDFNSARLRLGLKEIEVPSYTTLRDGVDKVGPP